MEHKKSEHDDDFLAGKTVWVIVLAAVLILFNQVQLFQLNSALGTKSSTSSGQLALLSSSDLSGVDVSQIKSTPQAVAATIDLSGAKDAQGVIDAMRELGHDVLQRWAHQQQQTQAAVCQATPGVNRKEKKRSTGTRGLDKSPS